MTVVSRGTSDPVTGWFSGTTQDSRHMTDDTISNLALGILAATLPLVILLSIARPQEAPDAIDASYKVILLLG